MLIIKCILLVIVFFFIKAVYCDEHEYKLINDLMRNYNIYARPSTDFRIPTNVTLGFSLSQLIDVDEKNQIITTNVWLTMIWSDNKLAWNESDYGGITEIHLPHDKIWRPDVILYNNADTLASLSQISTQMSITNNGNVTWLSTNIFKSSCSINVFYFPFDTQNCSLSFASWTYDNSGINLEKTSDDADLSNYIANGEWNIDTVQVFRNVRIYSCCPVPYPNVTYHIVIRRRPLFYVFNMILPGILITVVGFLGFIIPADSGEKIQMGVTTLLSMTVFLIVIAESMPPNSDSVPLLAIYYLSSMLIISLATAENVLSLNILKRGDMGEPLSKHLQFIFFGFFARLLMINIKVNRNIRKPDSVETPSPPTMAPQPPRKHVQSVDDNQFNQHHVCHMPYQRTSLYKMPAYDLDNQLMSKSSSTHSIIIKTQQTGGPYYTRANSQSRYDLMAGEDLMLRPSDINQPISSSSSVENKRLIKLLRALNNNLEKLQMKDLQEDYKQDVKNQWKALAKVIDIIMLYIFLIVTSCLFAYLINKVPYKIVFD